MDREILKQKLDSVNRAIEIYKKNAIENIEKEAMIPATNDLLLMRDLKEQQGALKMLLESEDKQ